MNLDNNASNQERMAYYARPAGGEAVNLCSSGGHAFIWTSNSVTPEDADVPQGTICQCKAVMADGKGGW